MAAAMNAIGYDAAALGNHEFNYGMDTLRAFQRQLHFPLLGANAVDWTTGRADLPAVRHQAGPHAARQGRHGRHPRPGHPRRGDLGPDNVEGKVRFPGIVEQAKVFVPAPQARRRRRRHRLVPLRRPRPPRRTATRCPTPRTPAPCWPQQVPDIDAILVGHAHEEIPERFVTNEKTGRQVLLSEPLKWGMRLTVMDLDLVLEQRPLDRRRRPRPPAQRQHGARGPVPWHGCCARDHSVVRQYVNSVIGSNVTAMSAATSRFEDTAAMDFINVRPGRGGQEGPGRHRRRGDRRCCRSRRRSTATRRSPPAT